MEPRDGQHLCNHLLLFSITVIKQHQHDQIVSKINTGDVCLANALQVEQRMDAVLQGMCSSWRKCTLINKINPKKGQTRRRLRVLIGRWLLSAGRQPLLFLRSLGGAFEIHEGLLHRIHLVSVQWQSAGV